MHLFGSSLRQSPECVYSILVTFVVLDSNSNSLSCFFSGEDFCIRITQIELIQ